jgi:hypothetical protein
MDWQQQNLPYVGECKWHYQGDVGVSNANGLQCDDHEKVGQDTQASDNQEYGNHDPVHLKLNSIHC